MDHSGDWFSGLRHQSVGQCLELPTAALFDFFSTVSQAGKEGIDLVTDFGGFVKASIRRDIFANPVPNGLPG